jgi:DNA-binding XRE family transcriptional regulator
MLTQKSVKPDAVQVLTMAVLRAADIMQLNQATLAQVLGVSPASISRMRNGTYYLVPATKEWELATLLVRLFRGLDAIMAGDEAALRSWLDSYNTALHGKPRVLLTKISSLARTVDYVDGYRARV